MEDTKPPPPTVWRRHKTTIVTYLALAYCITGCALLESELATYFMSHNDSRDPSVTYYLYYSVTETITLITSYYVVVIGRVSYLNLYLWYLCF